MPKGANLYVSAEVGRYWFGVTDSFYCTAGTVTAPIPALVPPPGGQCGGPVPPAFPIATLYPFGVPLPDYTTWNIGVGLTWSVFRLSDRICLNVVSANVHRRRE